MKEKHLKAIPWLLAALLLFVLSCPVWAQSESIVLADTIADSQTKSFSVSVTPALDSVKLSLFCEGQIDLDSLDVKFGKSATFKYKGIRGPVMVYTSVTNVTYSKVLTVDLDTAVTSYTVGVTTIPKSVLAGYDTVYFTVIAAASGNDATDPKQKVIAIITKY